MTQSAAIEINGLRRTPVNVITDVPSVIKDEMFMITNEASACMGETSVITEMPATIMLLTTAIKVALHMTAVASHAP